MFPQLILNYKRTDVYRNSTLLAAGRLHVPFLTACKFGASELLLDHIFIGAPLIFDTKKAYHHSHDHY